MLITRECRRRARRRERQSETRTSLKNVKPLVPSTEGAPRSQPSAAAHTLRAQELRHVGVLLRTAVRSPHHGKLRRSGEGAVVLLRWELAGGSRTASLASCLHVYTSSCLAGAFRLLATSHATEFKSCRQSCTRYTSIKTLVPGTTEVLL